jgi:hypothetical protein
MAKVITCEEGITHLRSNNDDKGLCGVFIMDTHAEENMLVCEHCAKAALDAIEGTTKKERKEWRDLL